MTNESNGNWDDMFDERQRGLIASCRQYVNHGAPGLPGHQLMLIVAKMAALLDKAQKANQEYQEKELARKTS